MIFRGLLQARMAGVQSLHDQVVAWLTRSDARNRISTWAAEREMHLV